MMRGSTLGGAAWADCESVIRRFEDAWRAQQRPDISSFIPPHSPHATEVLVELVHIDLEFRLRAGEPARTEEYLARFPELEREPLTLDLVAAEFALRNRHCPPAWPEEFWLRFPQYLAQLRTRLPVDGGTGWFAATRPAEPPGAPLSGTPVIAGYEIQGELGRGGMGVVYKARDLLLHRTVAIKTFATLPRAESCARFAREAESIARLDHPHIVPVYEVGEWHVAGGGPSVPYFVMKWYPGGSLDVAPAGPGTNLAAQARSVETIARAVHHAHQRGVLHRDLKPSNILLDDAGGPHVADFGLAGRIDPDTPTLTAIIAGTPAYMAPEQARNPREVSTAADVYGLGAILYHQITGQAPFAADTPLATLELVGTTTPTRPSAINPRIPRDLDTITLKCLEKDPARRYASAAELADDLERWRRGMPIAARPAPAWELLWRRVRRHPLVAAMLIITLGTLVGAVAVLADSNARIRAQEKKTADAYARQLALRSELEKSLLREQRALYLERVTSAGRLFNANQLPHAWALLDQCPEQFRGWEWRYLDSIRRARHVNLTGHETMVSRVGFLPDGRLLSIDLRGFGRLWDVKNQKELRTWSFTPSPITALAIHPKHPWAAIADLRSITVWNVSTGRVIARLTGTHWVAFNPQGTRAATSDGSVIRLWKVPAQEPELPPPGTGGKPVPVWEAGGVLRGHDQRVNVGTFTPDGEQLVTGSLDRTIRTWNVATGEEVNRRRIPTPVMELSFAAEGRVLAEAHSGAVILTNVATGETRNRFQHSANDRTAVVSGPDPRTVALTGANGEIMVWDVLDRRMTRVYRGHTSRVVALAFGPDGQLASGGHDETVRVWDLKHDQAVRTLAWIDGKGGLAVSPDGERIAIGPWHAPGETAVGTLVLDAATGRELHRLAGASDVAFHAPTGRLASGRVGGGMTLWDPVSGGEVWSKPFPEPHDPRVIAAPASRRLAFSADGSRLASWDLRAGGVQLWNPADGSTAGVIDPGGSFVYAIDFLPDGSRLVIANRDTVSLWDVESRTRIPGWDTGQWASAIAVSPDGRWLATVDRDRVLRLRDATTAKVVREFIGTQLRISALTFSPDSTRLLTGGYDRTVRVWDIETGRELVTLPGITGPVTGLAWNAKTDRIYAFDGALRVWGTSPHSRESR